MYATIVRDIMYAIIVLDIMYATIVRDIVYVNIVRVLFVYQNRVYRTVVCIENDIAIYS